MDRTECPEGIRRKEDFVCLIIGKCHFRPVDHRCLDEAELVHAKIQHHLFVRKDGAIFERYMEELLEHFDRLRRSDDLRLGMCLCECQKRTAVIRLHVIDDDVVKRTAFQKVRKVIHENVPACIVDPIQDTGLFIIDKVGVIGNPLRERYQIIKARRHEIVCADPVNAVRHFLFIVHHNKTPLEIRIYMYHYSIHGKKAKGSTGSMGSRDSKGVGAALKNQKRREVCIKRCPKL